MKEESQHIFSNAETARTVIIYEFEAFTQPRNSVKAIPGRLQLHSEESVWNTCIAFWGAGVQVLALLLILASY